MLILQGVLSTDEIVGMRNKLAAATFVDGKATASGTAANRKHNEQLDAADETTLTLGQAIVTALTRHPVFKPAAIPKRVLAPIFSRYVEGMEYGFHYDSPFMDASGVTVRTDLALTLFLSDPDSYEGGELVIQSNAGDMGIKLDAGDAVLYNAGSRHRVNPVSKGTRLAAVSWIESRVRDTQLREQIYDVSVVRERLAARDPEAPELELIDKLMINLLRMWGDS